MTIQCLPSVCCLGMLIGYFVELFCFGPKIVFFLKWHTLSLVVLPRSDFLNHRISMAPCRENNDPNYKLMSKSIFSVFSPRLVKLA